MMQSDLLKGHHDCRCANYLNRESVRIQVDVFKEILDEYPPLRRSGFVPDLVEVDLGELLNERVALTG
jgi:hypothetical protein